MSQCAEHYSQSTFLAEIFSVSDLKYFHQSGPGPEPDHTRQTFSQHESSNVAQSDFILKSLLLFQVLFEKSLHLSVKFDPN